MLTNVRFICEAGLFMIPRQKKAKDKKILAGDLYNINGKLCLVLRVTHHKNLWDRKVLIRWTHQEENYWIRYEILNDIVSDYEKR